MEDWQDAVASQLHEVFDGKPKLGTKRDYLPVSVVISGRNYGRYLGDAIESVQQQDPLPREIVYMDNASTDGSIALARSMGVQVGVVGPQERNICACRNRGAAMTKERYLLFMDADDVIPKGYVKPLVDAMYDERVAITFPRMSQFGVHKTGWNNPKGFGRTELLRENFIPGQSLVRRRAFEAVDGFGDLPAFQDWELWLRINECGWLFKHVPQSSYEHRTHADSLTSTFRHRLAAYQEVLRRQPMTIFTPIGPGRPWLVKIYTDMLDRMDVDWDKTTLVIYDDGCDPEITRGLKEYLFRCPAHAIAYYHDDTFVTWDNLINRGEVVPERLAEIWTHADDFFQGDFVMSIENDNDPFENDAISRMYEGMCPDVDAVTGVYHSRPIVGRSHVLALEWGTRKDGELMPRPIERHPGDLEHEPSDGCTEIGVCGVGWMLMRKEVLDGYEYPVGHEGNYKGQDFGLCRHIRERGRRLLAHWGIKTRHWYKPGEWV